MILSENLTIIIPCKNEGLTIKKTLDLLNYQKNIDKVSVIVADISDDGITKKILKKRDDKFNLTVIKGGLPSIARNNGFKLCKTPYVLFLDADIFLLDNELLDKSITSISLLYRNSKKGYALQHNLLTGTWVNIMFDEDINIPAFVEKIVGVIVGKIFKRVKQFIENFRM